MSKKSNGESTSGTESPAATEPAPMDKYEAALRGAHGDFSETNRRAMHCVVCGAQTPKNAMGVPIGDIKHSESCGVGIIAAALA